MEKIQYVVLETTESEHQDVSHAYASFWILSQSSFHWELWNLYTSYLQTQDLSIDILMNKWNP